MFAFAETCPIDTPRSGPSLWYMKFGPSPNHVSVPIGFVGVYEVAPRVFDLLDIDIGAQARHVSVMTAQHRCLEGDQVHLMVEGPWRCESLLDVFRGGDPLGEKGSSDFRQIFERE